MSYFTYLKTFVYVYRTGSYGNAAEALNMTQPTVSKHIISLEQQIGKTLFRRDKGSGKSYKATSFAKDLARELEPYVDKLENIFNASRATSTSRCNTVYLGGLLEFLETHLMEAITAMIPNSIRFVVQTNNADDWLALLEDQSLDMAIIPLPVLSEHIGFRQFLSDELCMVAHADLVKSDNSIKTFLELPYISYTTHMPCIREFISSFPPGMDNLQNSSKFSSFRMIKTLLMDKAGFSILPKQFVENELKSGELVIAKVDFDPVYMRLYLVWNKFSMRKQQNIYVRDTILNAVK